VPTLLSFFDPALDGPTNMARDEHLLYAADIAPAALRLYAWDPPTVSLGYFQAHTRADELPPELRALPRVRRLTGGGAILHDREITYCLVLDDSLAAARQGPAALYALAHNCWRDVLAADGIETSLAPDDFPLPTPRTGPFFCFEKPGRTDLLLGGRKVLGSAQRRLPHRVMQHGSLLLRQRFPGHPGVAVDIEDAAKIHAWRQAFAERVAVALGLGLQPAEWSGDRLADVAARRERFAAEEWTQRY
jgi:lipoate-protein ligase A